jgi:hypothetical protein
MCYRVSLQMNFTDKSQTTFDTITMAIPWMVIASPSTRRTSNRHLRCGVAFEQLLSRVPHAACLTCIVLRKTRSAVKPYTLRVQAMSVPVVRSGLGGIHLFGAGVA